MNAIPKLLALTLAGALWCSATAKAGDRSTTSHRSTVRTSTSERWQSRGPDVRADFRTTPRWRLVSGTRVYVPSDARLSYDLFRVGNTYYVYTDNGAWYRASRWNDDYAWVDANDVPIEIARVPQREWRSYPSEWANRSDRDWNDRYSNDRYSNDRYSNDRYSNDRYSNDRYDRDYRNAPPAPRIVMRTAPRWRVVPNTRIYVATNSSTDFDLFRVGNTYYLYSDGYWYRSNRWNGTFMATSEDRVPREFMRVPRNQWRHGPPPWANARSNREGSYR